MKINKLVTIIACVGGLAASNVGAIAINDPGVVGFVVSGEPADISTEIAKANFLLSLAANVVNQSHTIAGNTDFYSTSSTDYIGTIIATDATKDEKNLVVPAGYDFVWGKYDGPNGGAVLWSLNGLGMTLPADSTGLWDNSSGKGFGLSHFTVFKATNIRIVPPPGVPDGGMTVALLGLSLAGVAFLRRKLA